MKDFSLAAVHPSLIITHKFKVTSILVREFFYVYTGVKLGPVPRSHGSMFLTWSTDTSFSLCKADLFDRQHFCASHFIWQLTAPASGKYHGKAFLRY